MTVKIRFQLQISILVAIIFSTINLPAQDPVLNKHGLLIIKEGKKLRADGKSNPAKKMADIKKIIPDIVLDLRYTTTNNFMHKKLYPATTTTYLRLPAAKALMAIQKELRNLGLGLKIFDAYRPYTVTEKMWELVKDDRYAADPKKGSGHNRGTAVDVTLINLISKEELQMGTGYDNFSDTAHHSFMALPKIVLENRKTLRSTMEKHGFRMLETEWWHYSLPNAKDYELLDIPFKTLKKIAGSRDF